MHIRPRCREWMPLATQQLRLRNLCAISGINISCVLNSKLYYTLHYTASSNAFYTSEMVHCYDNNQQSQWAEILCTEMLKSNSSCVCVRVWEHTEEHFSMPHSALSTETVPTTLEPINVANKLESTISSADKLLFTWGVYLSGLVMVNHQASHAKCISNSLLFKINGEYFASPEHFTTATLREQLSLSYQRYSQSVPTTRQMPTSGSNSGGDEFFINSPKVSRSSSPTLTNNIDYNENTDLIRMNRDLLRMSKARYMELQYFCSEVRKSYNLEKLLSIQEMQRRCIKNTNETKEVAADIGVQSVLCFTGNPGNIRHRIPRSRYTSSMGRTLSVLLSQQNIMEPQHMAKAQTLQKDIETLQFKLSLLQQEHDRYITRTAFLRKKLTEHHEARLKLQSFLMSRHRNLSRDKELLAKKIQSVIEEIKTKTQTERNVERRISSLCRELKEIYPISRNKNGFFTISNIPFPNMDSYINDAKYASSCSLENVSPMTLSASLGYVAHLTQMIAVILNRPLRNPINHEGSRTRILDTIKDIPHASREFPLYTRSTIPSKHVKYAIYLLNQNIVQLSFEITGIRCDLRATIENILLIFDSFKKIEENQKDCLAPLVQVSAKDDKHNDGLYKSRSSIDLNNISVPQIQKGNKSVLNITEKRSSLRVCRSVGSYSDCEDDFRDIIDQTYSNSDTNLAVRNDRV